MKNKHVTCLDRGQIQRTEGGRAQKGSVYIPLSHNILLSMSFLDLPHLSVRIRTHTRVNRFARPQSKILRNKHISALLSSRAYTTLVLQTHDRPPFRAFGWSQCSTLCARREYFLPGSLWPTLDLRFPSHVYSILVYHFLPDLTVDRARSISVVIACTTAQESSILTC